jgi:hypothetical protein
MNIQKILAYDLYSNTTGTARYQRVCAVLEQSVEPLTLHPHMLACGQQPILCSPRARARDCLDSRTATAVTITPELNELAFSLAEFCSEELFLEQGSTAVRQAFIQAFSTDKLSVSHLELKAELDFILSVKNQPHPPLSISHTFRMKLLEIYATVGAELFDQPASLEKHLDSQNHFYAFGHILEL